MSRFFTDAERQTVIDMCHRGAHRADIAQQLNRPVTAIHDLISNLRSAGVDIPRAKVSGFHLVLKSQVSAAARAALTDEARQRGIPAGNLAAAIIEKAMRDRRIMALLIDGVTDV